MKTLLQKRKCGHVTRGCCRHCGRCFACCACSNRPQDAEAKDDSRSALEIARLRVEALEKALELAPDPLGQISWDAESLALWMQNMYEPWRETVRKLLETK